MDTHVVRNRDVDYTNGAAETLPQEVSLYERIRARLERDFIKADKIARVLALAIQSGKNVLLWGPGGHGKSEMVAAALAEVVEDDAVFVQSFGEGMDEATLWGGLDFRALEEEKVLRYHPEQSFLVKKHAVFEELFDAPAVVLLALKDTLTAKKLRKGSQQFKMHTKCIIALTNKNPSEISDLGPAAHALIERFPLQLLVNWPSYEAGDYLELFRCVGPRLSGADLNGMSAVMAEMLAKIGERDRPVSPRSAVHALGVVKTAAALRGSNVVEKVDLLDLQFVDGFEALAENLRAELDAATERAEAEIRLIDAEQRLKELVDDLEAARRKRAAMGCLKAAKIFVAFGDEVSRLKVTDGLTERRKQLREAASRHASEARGLAEEYTNI